MPNGLERIGARERAQATTDEEREAIRLENVRRSEARGVFMAARLIRPEGAAEFEFLLGHGFFYPDRATAKTAHLTL